MKVAVIGAGIGGLTVAALYKNKGMMSKSLRERLILKK